MDAKKLFCAVRNTDDASYRAYAAAVRAGGILLKYVMFPLVICAVLAGGALTAADGLFLKGGAAPEKGAGARPSRSEKCAASFTAENEEDVYNYNEELLQRLYEFDRSAVPEGKVGIIPVSLYRKADDGMLYISDAGDKRMIKISEYADREPPVKCGGDGYQVLIIHTHGTEAFSPEGALYCEPHSYPRSDSPDSSVIALGEIFTRVLNENGISTVHCTVPIDKESYSKAYSNAASIIKEYLKKYPGIKYMFDVHRDAIELTDGSKARMVTACDGKITAQIMYVVGTDRLVKENKNWRDNMALAVKMQAELDKKYPGLMRPINVKQGAFNQHLVPLSVLIEIGCDGNSMEEAERAAYIAAKQLAKTIKSD